MSEALRSRYLEALGVPEFLYAEDKFEDVDAKKTNTLCLVIETQNSRSFCQAGKYQDFFIKNVECYWFTATGCELYQY